MSYCCKDQERRDAVRQLNGWNGIDYVEVAPDQLSLLVYFLGKLPPELAVNRPGIEKYLAIEGGARITGIRIVDVDPVVAPNSETDDYLVATLDKAGDFSTYTLRLTGVDKIDPRYGSADFSFKVDCPSDLDCATSCECAPDATPVPEINYLAKDYASFRQFIFDRMALLAPAWTERHVPDLGVALVEVMAYEADYLSYYQDAVATEAYLDTARQRISVRRHARLVDYFLHEGCNARALVALSTDTKIELDPTATSFITGLNNLVDQRTVLNWDDLAAIPAASYEVFEPYDRQTPIVLSPAHNEIHFYTWGNRECCLAKGSTKAVVIDGGLTLKPGDWLIFEEVRGPVTGAAGDADPSHRHAVRLTRVERKLDPVIRDSQNQPQAYVEITWASEDALPLPLCISNIGGPPRCAAIDNISVARGNVVLVDHGRTTGPEDLGIVPEVQTEAECICEGRRGDIRRIPGKYAPKLTHSPLTFREAVATAASAHAVLTQNPRLALPQILLTSGAAPWEPKYDLIASAPDDLHYVVEIDNSGDAHLRFGDGEFGSLPEANAQFQATYRVGNGTRGNVGAESISRLVLRKQTLDGAGISVRNPFAARGGMDGEPMSEAKLFAPRAFRQQIERAIIAEDYDELCERHSKVQRASTDLVWTGSWYEADVAVDPLGIATVDATLRCEIETDLERYRRIGHDLHIEPAVYVPLDIEIHVCALPGYQAAHVRAALLDVFSNRTLPSGKKGFFHPDNQSFGGGIYLSAIVSAAHSVAGVECADVTRMQRLFEAPNKELENGLLQLAANEIAQFDNNPNYPERGKLIIAVNGGRQ